MSLQVQFCVFSFYFLNVRTFLQKDLEEMKLLEDEIAEVEREAQEDTTVVIPSAL